MVNAMIFAGGTGTRMKTSDQQTPGRTGYALREVALCTEEPL